jgi:hypothetical protein
MTRAVLVGLGLGFSPAVFRLTPPNCRNTPPNYTAASLTNGGFFVMLISKISFSFAVGSINESVGFVKGKICHGKQKVNGHGCNKFY